MTINDKIALTAGNVCTNVIAFVSGAHIGATVIVGLKNPYTAEYTKKKMNHSGLKIKIINLTAVVSAQASAYMGPSISKAKNISASVIMLVFYNFH